MNKLHTYFYCCYLNKVTFIGILLIMIFGPLFFTALLPNSKVTMAAFIVVVFTSIGFSLFVGTFLGISTYESYRRYEKIAQKNPSLLILKEPILYCDKVSWIEICKKYKVALPKKN